MSVPRDAAGNFLPPQYRLDSVRAADLRPGDLVSWNWRGRAEVCRVHQSCLLPNGRIVVYVQDPAAKCYRAEVVDFNTTVNRVEVLRG